MKDEAFVFTPRMEDVWNLRTFSNKLVTWLIWETVILVKRLDWIMTFVSIKRGEMDRVSRFECFIPPGSVLPLSDL